MARQIKTLKTAEKRLWTVGFTHTEIRSLYKQLKSKYDAKDRFDFMIKIANLDDVEIVELFDFI